jgi:perosamine synthetase
MTDSIPWALPYIDEREKKLINQAYDSTWISDGPFVSSFEEEFRQVIGSSFSLTTCNGTASLKMAMLALGVSDDSEVIVPGLTFSAPANQALLIGATPVYVEIDCDTWCIDPGQIEKSISKKTKAIVVVHLYGNVCNMDEIVNLSKKHNIALIEDCAQAVLSTYDGGYAGTFGDVGVFSFQATKTITTGEGGMVVTNEESLHQKMSLTRNHGMTADKKYFHQCIGDNFRMTNIQAAMGQAQLEKREEIVEKRKRLYQIYKEELSGVSEIVFQKITDKATPVPWALPVVVKPTRQKNRDKLGEYLSKYGIETRPGFYPFSTMPHLYGAPELPNCSEVGLNLLCLPFFTSLDHHKVSVICSKIRDYFGETK